MCLYKTSLFCLFSNSGDWPRQHPLNGWTVGGYRFGLCCTSLGQLLRVSTRDLLNFHRLAPVQDCLYGRCDGLNSFEQHRGRDFVRRKIEIGGRLNAEVRANGVGSRLSLQLALLPADLLPVTAGYLVAVSRPMQERMGDLMSQRRRLGRYIGLTGSNLNLVPVGRASSTIQFALLNEPNRDSARFCEPKQSAQHILATFANRPGWQFR